MRSFLEFDHAPEVSDAIFPDARYVFIVRHGLDATASAMRRWTGSTSLGYLARKARWTPPTDLPRFVWRTIRTRVASRSSDALATWGPRYTGMSEMAASGPLHAVCAEQWVRCVNAATDYLDELPGDRVLRLVYEDVVADPATTLARITEFIGVAAPDLSGDPAFTGISGTSVGKGARALAELGVDNEVLERIRPTLQRLGYGDRP